jgi:transcriptional regulator
LLKQLDFQAMTESSINHSLYNPPQFTSRDWALACTLLREHALASVVSVDGSGRAFISHVPLHTTEASTANDWRILGHVANANPHCALLHTQPQAVVTVIGPQAYMSPSVYPDKQRVPTWNYVALHVHVRVRVLTESEAKDALLKQLIADHEPAYAAQWRELPDNYTQAMLRAITGFELCVESWQLKIKLNQHRPEAAQTMAAQYDSGSDAQRGVVTWLQRWHDSTDH